MHAGKPTFPLPTPDRMADRCKYITLPQTSFAGGNYIYKPAQVLNATGRASYSPKYQTKLYGQNWTNGTHFESL